MRSLLSWRGAGRVPGCRLPRAASSRMAVREQPGRDLEITARGLEDAFLALTGDGPSGRNEAAT
jgi:hypothetical protein